MSIPLWTAGMLVRKNDLVLSPASAYTPNVRSLITATQEFVAGSSFDSSKWTWITDCYLGVGGVHVDILWTGSAWSQARPSSIYVPAGFARYIGPVAHVPPDWIDGDTWVAY